MNATIARRILGTIAGLMLGGSINMSVITLCAKCFPPPDGVDINQIKSISAHIGEYSALQLSGPLLGHALGTLAGAIIAIWASGAKGPAPAYVAAGCFFLGGVAMIVMIPNTPIWFIAADLLCAYIPMGWAGWRIAKLAP